MPDLKKQTPAARRGSAKQIKQSYGTKYTSRAITTKSSGWDGRRFCPGDLPSPLDYYVRELGKVSGLNKAGWAQAKCPFHQDRHASLSVRLSGSGNWRCFAGCGSGDLISFHMRRHGLSFRSALHDLKRRS